MSAQRALYAIQAKGGGGGAPIGSIIAVPSHMVDKFLENEPDAWLPCSDVDTTGTGLALYMARTPNLNGQGRFLQGTTGTSGTVEAGLPNIKGTHSGSLLMWNNPKATGAFTGCGYSSGWGYGDVMIYRGNLTFSAANANPIYSDDIHTVQPAAYTVRYYIRCNE